MRSCFGGRHLKNLSDDDARDHHHCHCGDDAMSVVRGGIWPFPRTQQWYLVHQKQHIRHAVCRWACVWPDVLCILDFFKRFSFFFFCVCVCQVLSACDSLLELAPLPNPSTWHVIPPFFTVAESMMCTIHPVGAAFMYSSLRQLSFHLAFVCVFFLLCFSPLAGFILDYSDLVQRVRVVIVE